jgi:hypothetical protein
MTNTKMMSGMETFLTTATIVGTKYSGLKTSTPVRASPATDDESAIIDLPSVERGTPLRR